MINVDTRKAKSKGRQPDPNIFWWMAESVADAAINPNGIKTFLTNGLSTFPDKVNPGFSNGPKSLPKNPDCTILCNWVFDNFIICWWWQLQQIPFNYSSDIDFHDFLNLLKKCTAKPCSFLVIDVILASDKPLHFRKNLLERK